MITPGLLKSSLCSREHVEQLLKGPEWLCMLSMPYNCTTLHNSTFVCAIVWWQLPSGEYQFKYIIAAMAMQVERNS